MFWNRCCRGEYRLHRGPTNLSTVMVIGGAVKWWESYRLLNCRQVGRRGSKNALGDARHHRIVVVIEDEGVRLACRGVYGGLERRPDVTVENSKATLWSISRAQTYLPRSPTFTSFATNFATKSPIVLASSCCAAMMEAANTERCFYKHRTQGCLRDEHR